MEVTVEAPMRRPAYNTIFDTTQLRIVGDDNKWQQFGVEFTAAQGGAPCVIPVDQDCGPITFPVPTTPDPIAHASIEDPQRIVTHQFYPFDLEWAAECTASQIRANESNLSEFVAMFRDAFDVGTHKSAAATVWSGITTGTNPVAGLIDVGSTNQLTNTLGIVPAIGQLSQALASTGAGSMGVLHMTPYVANLAVANHLLYRNGKELRTVVGDHLVIADGGYAGTKPRNVVPAQPSNVQWVYATGPMYYLLSEPTLYAPVDQMIYRTSNRQMIIFHSTALFMWDKTQWFGIPVVLS